MSAYPPPTQILSLFNPLYFETSDVDITVGYLDTNYLKFPIAQGLENLQKTNITDATQSTSVSTGSLVTAGGVGIAKQTHIGGQLHCTSTATSTSTTTGCIRASGGVGVAENINAGGIIKTTSTTASTDTTTGALQVAGGAGIVGAVNVGGVVSTTNNITTTSEVRSINIYGGSRITPGYTLGGATTYSGLLEFLTPNLTRLGYIGNVPNIGNVGTGNIEINLVGGTTGLAITGAETDSTTTLTGQLKLSGGAGIVKNLTVGANLVCGGSNGTDNPFTSFTSKKYSGSVLGAYVNAFSITTTSGFGAGYLEVIIMGTYFNKAEVCIKYEFAIAPGGGGSNSVYVNNSTVASGNNLPKTLSIITGNFELRQTTSSRVTTFAVYNPEQTNDYAVYVRYLVGGTAFTGTITML